MKSTMDRIHIDLYNLAEEIAKSKHIPRVQAYREVADMARGYKKRLKQLEPKDLFRV